MVISSQDKNNRINNRLSDPLMSYMFVSRNMAKNGDKKI